LNNFNALIIGTPTHGGRPSQPMQQLLSKIPAGSLAEVRAAAFDTGIPAAGQNFFLCLVIKFFSYASKKLAISLRSKGANVVAAETFFVLDKEGSIKDGKLERSREWGKQITKNQ